MKSRLHTPISTVVHAKVVCAPKILPIGIFPSHILRSKIIALWDMSQYQNSLRISLETSVFYLNFRVRFFLAMLWTSKLDTAAEETWVYCSTVPLAVERKLTSYPSFFRDPVQFACSKHIQKEANSEIKYGWEKCRSGGLSVRKPPPHGQRSKSECEALTSSFDRNNSDGKATLKQQKTLETTTETQDLSKCYWFYV